MKKMCFICFLNKDWFYSACTLPVHCLYTACTPGGTESIKP